MLQPFLNKNEVEAGCDEAGRGCLAGPVFAAAVILPTDFEHTLLNDSKQLSEKQRQALRPVIEKQALAWAVAQVDAPEIDEINILNASFFGNAPRFRPIGLASEFDNRGRQSVQNLSRYSAPLHRQRR